MNSTPLTPTPQHTPESDDPALQLPENMGIDFGRLQAMVDEIERELVQSTPLQGAQNA